MKRHQYEIKFNRNLPSISEDDDDGYEFPLDDYSSKNYDGNISSIIPITTLTTYEYEMGRQMNDELEVAVGVNYVATYDDSTITNEQ